MNNATEVVREYVRIYHQWCQNCSVRLDELREGHQVDDSLDEVEYERLVVPLLASSCFGTGYMSHSVVAPDSVSSEVIERAEIDSPVVAHVFTFIPGLIDERWRYDLVFEHGQWLIAKKVHIEFDGKPWDAEQTL